jgi:putative transposase
MSRYRRALFEGGTFFFTVTLADRSSDLLVRHIGRLRRNYAYVQQRRPFETVAICVLPDHVHAIWQLPPNDADFPLRWSLIKSSFSRGLAVDVPRTPSGNVGRNRFIGHSFSVPLDTHRPCLEDGAIKRLRPTALGPRDPERRRP